LKKVRLQDEILNIEQGSTDYLEMENIKKENNPSYSLEEVKTKFGL